MAAGSDHVDEGGAAVEAVLGLSMTSTGVGWVLLDGQDADAAALDHDAFDVGSDGATEVDISKHSAAVRGAQAIATASGHRVKSIGVTWTDDVDGQATLLLKSLPDLGFDNIIEIRLPEATRRWADAFGPVLGFTKCALCVMESTAATVLVVANGTVHTSVTEMRESMDGLSGWLKDLFEQNRWQPDTVFLAGPRGDLELMAEGLEEALQTSVVASDEAQLALARGAALALSPKTIGRAGQAGEDQHTQAAATTTVIAEPESAKPDDDSPTQRQPSVGEHARDAATTTVIAEPESAKPDDDSPTQRQPSVGEDAPAAATTTVVAEPESTKPVDIKPTHRRARFGPHARAATVLVAGVIALFAVGPELLGQKESRSTENRPAANSSAASAPSASDSAGTSSASVHAVPSPPPVRVTPQEARPLAAEPPPAPMPPVALPPIESPDAEPVDDRATATSVVAEEEPVAAQPAAAPHLPVTEQPAVAPHSPATDQPVLAPQAPVAAQPAVAPPMPFALPPWLLPPPAQTPPQPVAPQQLVAPPPAANPAPAAANAPPPAANPVPAALPPPAPNPAAPPPPPQDPVAVVFGPFFGALP